MELNAQGIDKSLLIPDDEEYSVEGDMRVSEDTRIEIASEKMSSEKRDDVDLRNIEDILTAPIDRAKLAEKRNLASAERISEEKKKLQSIFTQTDIGNLIYETDESGNLILGYEEVKDENGNLVRKPIIQEKVYDWEMELQIEPKLDDSPPEADSLGLLPEERKRYDKLVALNNASGGGRSTEEMIEKAKQVSDLDSSIIPDMMIHFVTEKEDQMIDLSERDRAIIKETRRKGFLIEPETLAGFRKSLKLAAKDRTIHMRNLMMYFTEKGFDMATMDEEKLDYFLDLYRKERRPALPLVIRTLIDESIDIMCEKIKIGREDKIQAEEDSKLLRMSKPHRMELLKYCQENGEKFFDYDDFRKIDVYFRFYGLHEEDAQYFNPGFIVDPKATKVVTMREIMNEFKEATGMEFIDFYKYHWERVKKLKEEDDRIRAGNRIAGDAINADLVEGPGGNMMKPQVADLSSDIIPDIDLEDIEFE